MSIREGRSPHSVSPAHDARSSHGASVAGLRSMAPVAAFYDRIARAYELVADTAEHRARKSGLELLQPCRTERLLELGTGTGRALLTLGRRATRGSVCGIDISREMVRLARERVQRCPRIDVAVADARRLPFRDGSFDAAFASFLLELLEPAEIRRVLGEVSRVLRDGGRLAAVALAATGDHGLASNVYAWLHRRFPQFVDCGPIALQRVVQEGGFEIVEARELGLFGLPVVALLALR